jgi:DNA ligase-1
MTAFAELLDALLFTPSRNGKLRLMRDFFTTQPDPERGWALAALTGGLAFREAKAGQIRELAMRRVDPELFAWSYDFVGDLAETVSLIWPERGAISSSFSSPPRGEEGAGRQRRREGEGELELFDPDRRGGGYATSPFPLPGGEKVSTPPQLSDVVRSLATASRGSVAGLLERWLDALDATGRWALLKLVTSGLRVGVSARLAKTALAELGEVDIDEVEAVWHGLDPPYPGLFAWLEGKGERPDIGERPSFHPLMLANPLEDRDLGGLDPLDYAAEWKWDGIRVQLVSRGREKRIYSRSGDEIGKAFPEILEALAEDCVLDGELLVLRAGEVAPFNDLQQRLNRKLVSGRMLAEYPAWVRLYDALSLGREDLRRLGFVERRQRLEAWFGAASRPRLDLSPLIEFASWEELSALRDGARARGIEGLMLKRRDAPYVAGRPKGPWFKWKRGALTVDTVLMYAQRGHGKRSSFYSDYTFGAWRGGELVPVGKAYSGFTDEELVQLDRWVRNNTVNRYGPVREVKPGLVLEIAFDSVQRSTRHKSGIAMRFPRVHRIRWDKPFEEADKVETLEQLIA